MRTNLPTTPPSRHHTRPGWRRTALLSSLALASGLGASLVAITPASAVTALPTLTGVVRVELESPDNSATAKTVTVACPAGTKVINAGGYISDGGGSVAMDDIYPNDTLTEVEVTGKETDAYAVDWEITAFATCADEPAGLEWIWDESDENSVTPKDAEAVCSPGKTLLGTGATVKGGQGEVVVDEIKPNGGPGTPADRVTVLAYEADTFGGDWTVNALAICADPLTDQEVVSDSSLSDSVNKGAGADCDPTQVATGSGAEIIGAAGLVVLDDSYPRDGSTTSAPTATTVYGQEEDTTGLNWSIKAYVLCAAA